MVSCLTAQEYLHRHARASVPAQGCLCKRARTGMPAPCNGSGSGSIGIRSNMFLLLPDSIVFLAACFLPATLHSWQHCFSWQKFSRCNIRHCSLSCQRCIHGHVVVLPGCSAFAAACFTCLPGSIAFAATSSFPLFSWQRCICEHHHHRRGRRRGRRRRGMPAQVCLHRYACTGTPGPEQQQPHQQHWRMQKHLHSSSKQEQQWHRPRQHEGHKGC